MSNILPVLSDSNRFSLPKAVDIQSISTTNGTHVSHSGIGGYVELPNELFRDDIPSSDQMNPDGLSTGRRKLGMVVHDLSANKFFQLIPLEATFVEVPPSSGNFNVQSTTTGERMKLSAFNAFSDLERVSVINPMSMGNFDGNTGNTYNGSGVPSDAWVEISVPSVDENVISQNKTVTNVVTISQADYDSLVAASTTDVKTLYVIL